MLAFCAFSRHVRTSLSRCRTAPWCCYSTASSSSAERVTVPVHSNGQVTLNIHHPLTRSSPCPRLILHLPHLASNDRSSLTSTPWSGSHDSASASQLAITSSCPVVTVNYRLSKQTPFPTPIHDVLAAYDWAVKHLTPVPAPTLEDAHAHDRYGHVPSQRITRVGVLGNGIGGSLGLMLALTECKLGQRSRVSAISVESPICDWSDLDIRADTSILSTPTAKKRSKSSRTPHDPLDSGNGATSNSTRPSDLSIDRRALLRLRDELFSAPAKYFDPFASPTLFLRTPARDVPSRNSVEDEFTRLMLSTPSDDDHADHAADASTKERQRRRKVPLKWPPPGLPEMVMPRMRIVVPGRNHTSPGAQGPDVDDDILTSQSEELVRLLRRALVRGSFAGRGVGDKFLEQIEEDDGGEGLDGSHELDSARRAAESWVELLYRVRHAQEGISDEERKEVEVRRLGAWFDAVLR